MGTQGSVPVREGHTNRSRSPSPLPGADEDEGFDGLPRSFPSTMPDAAVGFSDAPDQPQFASQQPEPAKKTRKKRKGSKKSLEFEINANRDAQEEPGSQVDQGDQETQDLELSTHDMKTEPESPEALKKKKKKSRKAKIRASEGDESLQPPVLETQAESQILGNDAAPGHTLLQDVEAELQPPPEPSTTRKKRRKGQNDKSTGKPLELGDDPIAGSDEDDIIPSSARASERHRSVHGSAADGAKKFKQPEPIAVLNSEAIEDALDPQLSVDVVASTQNNASYGHFGSNVLVGESSFLAVQDVSSPLLARKDRREKSASRQASVVPPDALSQPHAEDTGSELMPPAPMELDPMDVDSFHPSQPSEQSQVLGYEEEDDAVDDATQSSPSRRRRGSLLADHDMTSEIDDDTMLAMAASQELPAMNRNPSTTNDSDNEQAEDLPSKPSSTRDEDLESYRDNDEYQGQSTAGSVIVETGAAKDAKQPATKGRVRKATQRQDTASSKVIDEIASDAPPASTVESDAEPAEDDAARQREFNALFFNQSHGEEEQGGDKTTKSTGVPTEQDHEQPNTPARTTPTPTQASGRLTRSYKKRQPKPSFYEREAQDNADAFAELPADEAADPPKKRARPRRRLPVDIPGEDSEPPSSAPKRKRQRKAKKAQRGSDDEDGEGDTTLGGGMGDDRYLKGTLTENEYAILDRVVERFRTDHDMTQYEVNEVMKQDPREDLPNELWSKLASACTSRKRQKIINVCRQRFHNFVARGTWTKEQDEELLEQINLHGQKWSIIGKEINRHQKDVRDRWRNYLVCRGKVNELHWAPEEETMFLDIVLEALRIFDAQRKTNPDIFEKKTNEQLVDWGIVSERMGHTRTRLQCQEKWRRLRAANRLDGRFAGQLPAWIPYGASWRHEKACKELRQFTHDDKYNLVCAVSEADVRSDAKIPWAKVEERMGMKGKVERVTPIIMWSRLRAAVPGQENKTTTQCAEYLVEMYEHEAGAAANFGESELDADVEQRIINDYVATEEAKAGAKQQRSARTRKRFLPKSEAVILESELGNDELDQEHDVSQTNVDGETQLNDEDAEMEDADQVSVDLADDSELATLQHQSVADPSEANDSRLDDPASKPDPYDPVAAHEEIVPARAKSRRVRKIGQANTLAAIDEHATSTSKKSKKRKDTGEGVDTAPGSPKASRKRMRIDNLISPPSPDKAARKKASKARKATRPGEAVMSGQGYISSDMDDMEDIPARLPIATFMN